MFFLRMSHASGSGYGLPPSSGLGRVIAVAFMSVLLWSCAGPSAPPPPMAPVENSYRLGSGDLVRIKVFGEQNLSGEHRVDGGGALTLPLVGRVESADMTPNELKKHLENRYSEYLKTPDISIEVLTYRPFYIVGEVNKPGNYPYVDGMTVINGVAIAGGFTYRANTDDFYIQRKGNKNEQYSAEQATEVRPGDVIVVRERFF